MTEITNNTDHGDPVGRAVPRAALLNDAVILAMAHFTIDPATLQPFVPMPLDTRRGAAFVTLVRFGLTNLRLPVLPRLTAALLRPVSDHRLLNVRTYVRPRGGATPPGSASGGGDGGIYFLREFTDHRLNSVLAPRLYGTPYHRARFGADGSIADAAGGLRFTVTPCLNPTSAAPGSLDHFLLERYGAWCDARGRLMRFDMAHRPWRYRPAAVRYDDLSLLTRTFAWFRHARPVTRGGGHACFPLRDVRIGFPCRERSGLLKLAVPETAGQVVVDQPHGLKVGVADA